MGAIFCVIFLSDSDTLTQMPIQHFLFLNAILTDRYDVKYIIKTDTFSQLPRKRLLVMSSISKL